MDIVVRFLNPMQRGCSISSVHSQNASALREAVAYLTLENRCKDFLEAGKRRTGW